MQFGHIEFLTKKKDASKVRRLLKYLFADHSKDKYAVVAYVGKNPFALIGPESCRGLTVICDATSIGTNPDGVRSLQGKRVKVLNYPNLHSKVYVSSRGALVGSGNLSWNGFGDSVDKNGLEEAFVWIPPSGDLYESIVKYCSELEGKNNLKRVTQEDLIILDRMRERMSIGGARLLTLSEVKNRRDIYLCLWFGEMTIPLQRVQEYLPEDGSRARFDYFEEDRDGAKLIRDSEVLAGYILPRYGNDRKPVVPQKILQGENINNAVLFITEKHMADPSLQAKAKEILDKLYSECNGGRQFGGAFKRKFNPRDLIITQTGGVGNRIISSVFVEFNSALLNLK